MKYSTRALTRGAMIAAMYVALTLIFAPISFREIQFRISEALTLMPILTAEAVPGLFIGCLLANQLAGAPWFDVVFGALATLLAAALTRKFRNQPALAAAMPVLSNGLIVGPVVYFAYLHAPGTPLNTLLLCGNIASVALGEAVVCYLLGLGLIYALRKTSPALWEQK